MFHALSNTKKEPVFNEFSCAGFCPNDTNYITCGSQVKGKFRKNAKFSVIQRYFDDRHCFP